MPIPAPRKGEKRSAFVSRCVEDAIMKREYPNTQQRVAVCEQAYDKKHALLISTLQARGFTPCQIEAEIARIERDGE